MIQFAPGALARLRDVRGEVWDPNRIEYVFALAQPDRPFVAAHPELRVAPISFDLASATDLDLICVAGEGGMKQPFLVELWNQCTMLVEELAPVPVGVVTAGTLANVYAVHNSMVDASEPVPSHIIGKPIEVETDPRIAYQHHRADLADLLARGANALLVSAMRGPRPYETYEARSVVDVQGFDEPSTGAVEWPALGLIPGSELSHLAGETHQSIASTYKPAVLGNAWPDGSADEKGDQLAGILVVSDPFQRHAHEARYASASNSLAMAA